MSSTEKKPRLVSVNPILTDNELIKCFQNAYTSRLPIDEKGFCAKKKTKILYIYIFFFNKFLQVVRLEHEPFSYCIIDDFLLDKNLDQFCNQLSIELNNIKLNQKNNDLYKFQQVRKNI